MARKPHKYHYIYKTTCNVTGKYYIGMHSCSNLDDGYMGSGKKLRYSLNKHGIENHTKEILEFLDDRYSLKKREKEIVNEEILQDPLCMNLQLGGGGGLSTNPESLKRMRDGASRSLKMKWTDNEYRKKICIILKENNRIAHINGNCSYDNFKGKSHTEETKKKMSESSKGKGTKETNSQFGTCWITNGIENRKIKKEEQIPDGWTLGRKIKF